MLRRRASAGGGGGGGGCARVTRRAPGGGVADPKSPPALGPGWVLEGPPPLVVSVSGRVSRAGVPRLGQSNPAQGERQHNRGFDGGSRPGAQRPHSDSVRVPGLFLRVVWVGAVCRRPRSCRGGGGRGLLLHSKGGGAWPRATPWELSRSVTKRDRPLPPPSSSSSPPPFSTLVLRFPPPSPLGWARPPPSEITPPPRCVCHPAHARERVCGPPTLGADPSSPVPVGGGARCVLVVLLPLPASACSLLPARRGVCLLPAAA